jgi:hypothetical protein
MPSSEYGFCMLPEGLHSESTPLDFSPQQFARRIMRVALAVPASFSNPCLRFAQSGVTQARSRPPVYRLG